MGLRRQIPAVTGLSFSRGLPLENSTPGLTCNSGCGSSQLSCVKSEQLFPETRFSLSGCECQDGGISVVWRWEEGRALLKHSGRVNPGAPAMPQVLVIFMQSGFCLFMYFLYNTVTPMSY